MSHGSYERGLPIDSRVLGIETSCDECSAAIVRYQPKQTIKVLSVATFSQVKIHQPYGGVVPEIASRNHLETINQMIDQALDQAQILPRNLDAIAVTNRPGLIGALLVGVSAAKAMAYALNLPLIPVHHLEGHAASIYLDEEAQACEGFPLPLLLAIVSGGHTNLYCIQKSPEEWPLDLLKTSLVGRSRDDAAGEAFDKTAKILGFPYPGGVWIEQISKDGSAQSFSLPRALPQKSTYDFSFSGLKTAVSLISQDLVKKGQLQDRLPDLCASVQEAIVDALTSKIFLAIRDFKCRSLAVVGGVAANRRLRVCLEDHWKKVGLEIPPLFPKLSYCTDNAAMIAAAGAIRFQQGHFLKRDQFLTLNAIANPEV